KRDPAQPEELSRARLHRAPLRASNSAALFDRTLCAVSEGTARAVDTALQSWAASQGARVTLHDIVRRYGAGVSSYPLYRYYLLVEIHRTPSSEGEVLLLELKELRDPVGWSGLARESASAALPAAAWAWNDGVLSNGARVVTAQRLFQGTEPPYDPWLSAIEIGPLSFRLRHLSGCQRGLDFQDLIDHFAERDDLDGSEELKALMRFIGARLAEAHGRPLGRDGRAGWEVIATELSQARLEALIMETLRFTESYARRLRLDHAHLRAIIDEAGPLLGLEARLSIQPSTPADKIARPFLDDPPPPAANMISDE
ncbi:MAG: DUF2252 family protein, partial [Myxococcota bacterium]|nr:DUF2252 family protein [Myxococcota bacterium]